MLEIVEVVPFDAVIIVMLVILFYMQRDLTQQFKERINYTRISVKDTRDGIRQDGVKNRKALRDAVRGD